MFPLEKILKPPQPSGYDRAHTAVTHFTGVGDAGEDTLMASPFFESRPAAEVPWAGCPSTFTRSYMLAAMRAGVIALVLLGVLALVVLF